MITDLPQGKQRTVREVFKEVWGNLSALHSWGQVAGCSILLGTTFVPVFALWSARRIRPDEPLLPLFVAISLVGGTIGMPFCYPKKGYWLPGVIAGPLFGPGVFLAFWLLAGQVMNRLVLLALTLVGGGPSIALYVFLLMRRTQRRSAFPGSSP